MKQQCMHCIDPACVSGCPMGALSKGRLGIVGWNGDMCIGCRYCQMACPYNIPKFEWNKVNPKIVKCELCRHRIAVGGIPACVEVCPVHAVIYGKRADLLAEAKRRIARRPGFYYRDRVYGEKEGGGTQVLYLSHVPFEKLGLPALGDTSLPSTVRKVENTVYQGFLTPLVAYGALAAIVKNRWGQHERQTQKASEEEQL
jgi:Fe-S-cluster-containing dehydrogenase component